MIRFVALLMCSLMLSGCFGFIAGAAVAGVSIINDRRDTKIILQDKDISHQAYLAVESVPALAKRCHIVFNSYNRILLVTGQAPTAALKSRAIDAIAQVPHVKRIYNEIEIEAPTSAIARSNDVWLTTKVRTELLLSKNIHSGQISILTENGKVYLMGLVTPKEGEAAVQIVRKIPGIRRVVKLFEYLSVVN